MTPSATITDQIKQARDLGYGDDEIISYLSQRPDLAPKITEAQNNGYQNNEILEYLGKQPTTTEKKPDPYQSPLRNIPVVGKPLAWYDENMVEPGLNQASEGAKQFVQGLPKLATHEGGGKDIVGGATNVVQGLGRAVAPPFLAEGAVAAPLATALGVGTGAALDWGTKTALDALGFPKEYSEGAGTAAGLAAGFGVNPFLDSMGRINQAKYSAKIFKPGEHEVSFPETTPGALSDIKTYGNPRVATVKDTLEAATPTINRLQATMDRWVNNGTRYNAELNGDVLVNATRQAIPDLIWQRDPATANQIVREAQAAFGGRRFPVDRVRDWLRTGNSSRFYSQAGYKQNAAALSGTAPAIEAAQTDAMRAELYPLLDPANGGAGPREVQSRTSDVINARNNASRREPQVAGEGAASGWEGLANMLTSAARIAGAPFQHQDIATSLRQFWSPMEGKTNLMLRALYKQIPQAPPIPEPPTIAPGGATVPVVPGYNSRQLPQGTAPFTQGTITINPSAQRGPIVPRGLPPGSPTQGQGVIHVPPAGAAEWLHGPDTSYRQAGEFTPREGAAPADTSYVRSVPAAPHPPAQTPPGVLAPGDTQRVIDMFHRAPGGSQAGPEWWEAQPPTKPEIQARYQELFNRAENLSPQRPVRVPETGPPEKISRLIDAQDNIAKQVLRGRSWKDATPSEREAINSLIREGYGSAPPQDMIVLKDPDTGQLYSVPRPPAAHRSGGVVSEPLRSLERRTLNRKAILASLGG